MTGLLSFLFDDLKRPVDDAKVHVPSLGTREGQGLALKQAKRSTARIFRRRPRPVRG